MAKKIPVILGSEHLRAIDVIQERIGTPTYAAAIRYALLEQASAIEREAEARRAQKRSAEEDGTWSRGY